MKTHSDEETNSAPSPTNRTSDPDIDLVYIKETTKSPTSPDTVVTMESILENNPLSHQALQCQSKVWFLHLNA